MTQTGRPSIYSPKDGDKSYRALALTKLGQQLFEKARQFIKKSNPDGPAKISDSDTIDMLAREWWKGRTGQK